MTASTSSLYEALDSLGDNYGQPLPVTLSPEVIGLLSEQLYRSPSKAIEELVVNGFDAEAEEARVFVPKPGGNETFIAVYDDGNGMDYAGLADLWKVGRPKVRDESVLERKQRKQIGKFGIGKLATYAVANRVTYVTKAKKQHLAVNIDYRAFVSRPNATSTPIGLEVRRFDEAELWDVEVFRSAVREIGRSRDQLGTLSSWTIVILEDLKERAAAMTLGRLEWVLRTAMPLKASFKLFLNGKEVESSKERNTVLVDFKADDLEEVRINALTNKTGEEWSSREGKLFSASFPSGISGTVIVTKETLGGKSLELGRSGGFFVYVRDRLVNEEDERFGLHAHSFRTFNRFRADINIDNLDQILTANRESMEDVKLYRDAQAVLNEIFNQARQAHDDYLKKENEKELGKREDTRSWVPNRLVEIPTADAMTIYGRDRRGTEPDGSWMYLAVDPTTDIADLTSSLYSQSNRENPYSYKYVSKGRSGRLVSFDPRQSTFTINEDHELVIAYGREPSVQGLFQDLVTSEALLEVYLREAGISPYIIGEVLERRDLLLRGLADAHLFSLDALGTYIEDSANKSTELEIALVAGARALGFVAKHISGNGEPDGIARFTDFPLSERKITLEAKSSDKTPKAKDIDFSALGNHMEAHGAEGCLLVAPGYQGDEDGSAARSAVRDKISCWTVKQFADVIRAAESRQISARDVIDVVGKYFTPLDVSTRINELLSDPLWEPRGLYLAIVESLRNIHEVLPNSPRNITMVAMEITRQKGFEQIEKQDVRTAVSDLAGASQGALRLNERDEVILNVDYDELHRRVQTLLGEVGRPRRNGAFGEVTQAE